MKVPFLGLVALAAPLLTAGSPSSGATPEPITIVDVGPSAVHWPAYAALKKGFFAKGGVSVDYVTAASSASGLQQVAAGSADIASAGFPDSIRAIDKGAPIGLLRIEEGPAPYEIYAKPNIHSFADLKGKIVMLGGAKDVTRTYFERMAFSKGLAPGGYDMVYAGAASARLSGLFSGSVDAAILSPPFNFKAQAAHYSLLPAATDFSKGLPFTSYAINTRWATPHRSLVSRFLAAYAQGVDWFYDPTNREEAVNILMSRLPIERAEAEQTYDFYVSHKMFGRVGAVTHATVQSWLQILKAQGDIDGSTDSPKFYTLDLAAPH